MYNGRIPKKPVRFVSKPESALNIIMGWIALGCFLFVVWFIFVSLAGG
jgi:hypothetical protein